MPDLAWSESEFDLLLASGIGEVAAEPSAAEPELGLFDALAPLVTDVFSPGEAHRGRGFEAAVPPPAGSPVAAGSQRTVLRDGAARRRALLRAIAELAETHAAAADLACRQAAIDLPLDVPDPVFHAFDEPVAPPEKGRTRKPMLIVPDVIRTCRDRLAAYTGAGDRMKIDIVATLFDHVLADDRLPTEIRNSLARLQLPVLRMALADDTFFLSRTHPTRRLLDRLAQASLPPAAEGKVDSDSVRSYREELDRVVHAVIHGSSEDAAEHARLLEDFERRLVEIAATSTPAPALVTDEEDRDVLVIKATIQISQLLAGLDVDRAIRFFLLDVWSRVLAEIVCASSDPSRDAMLARAKRLCVDLAWSAAPKTTSGERARLAGLLPTMIEALRAGLAMIDFPRVEQDRFFTDWARLLYLAVKRPQGAGGTPRFRLAGSDTPDVPEGLDIDDFARRLREGSFGPEIPRIATAGETASASAGTEPRPGLRTADDATPSMVSAAAREAADALPVTPPPAIADLKKGEWFELRDESGKPGAFVKVRLSWISPLKSFYLFIGADSALTRSFDPGALGALLARGDLRRVAVA